MASASVPSANRVESSLNARTVSVVLPPPIYEDFEANGGKAAQRRRRFRYAEMVANLAVLFLVCFVVEQLFKWVGPYRRGFFCDDNSIRLPYKSGSTFPDWLLPVYSFGVTAFVFAIGECICLSRVSTTTVVTRTQYGLEVEEGDDRLRLFLRFVYFYGIYLIAFVANFIFTLVAKYSFGRLRPHFIDLCKPNVTEFCADSANWHIYIENYECDKGLLQEELDDARLSFFSGHSSRAMCASVFIAIYLHARLSPLFRARLFVVVPLFQIAFLSIGMLISYSRVRDHDHHSTDVLIGIFAGTSVATFTALYIAGLTVVGPTTGQRCAMDSVNCSKNGGKASAATVTERL